MEAVLARLDLAGQSLAVMFLLYLAPVAITVAAIASWRSAVRGASMIVAGGIAYCLWLMVPLGFALPELRQLSQFASILGWVWLMLAWGRLVLTEWPVPMWGHWIAGTVLLALPVVALVAVLTP
ncbi:hypothetical protein HYN69_09680 [Gemmobacter aquarius]|uniref:Uncharacterized protein n=1 Tax=Paragemmobacter aquarius TaxID=2169400 RepID=A0A2S0ULR9_9RHOB|nr:hypothetical protein [Gemmobacter aquarius]AWB48746.1 hypothetical protein HYN69_09680 [Gemmobacter aquarius]